MGQNYFEFGMRELWRKTLEVYSFEGKIQRLGPVYLLECIVHSQGYFSHSIRS